MTLGGKDIERFNNLNERIEDAHKELGFLYSARATAYEAMLEDIFESLVTMGGIIKPDIPRNGFTELINALQYMAQDHFRSLESS